MAKEVVTTIEEITVQVFTCTRCNYRWVPEFAFNHWQKDATDGAIKTPVACAHCHSPYYNKLRRNDGKSAG